MKQKDNIDWQPVLGLAYDYVEDILFHKSEMKDAHYKFYELLLETIYGEDVWRIFDELDE